MSVAASSSMGASSGTAVAVVAVDFIRSSDCYDRHGNEIFEGDMASYMGTWPVQIVDVNGRVGYFEDGKLVDVTSEWSAYAEIVGRNGALCNW